MSRRILVVEDEPELARTLCDLLSGEGYGVEVAPDGPTGMAKAVAEPFDLVILDLFLPGKNGLDICRELRQQGKDLAILMVAARSQLADRILSLKLGADDYVTGTFEPAELLARIEALLRRVRNAQQPQAARYRFDGVEIDFEMGHVRKNGTAISLAAKELDLLHYLMDRRGKTVSRGELLEAVWAYQPGVSSRTIDVHVAWLRQKLEDTPQRPKHIHTVRGVGYRFSG